MKFLANENFPGPSITLLRKHDINIKSIVEQNPRIADEQVMKLGINEKRTILTHDSDYGELIFKFGFRPEAGVVYFRIYDFEPSDPGKILLGLIDQEISFGEKLTVINEHFIRQRSF